MVNIDNIAPYDATEAVSALIALRDRWGKRGSGKLARYREEAWDIPLSAYLRNPSLGNALRLLRLIGVSGGIFSHRLLMKVTGDSIGPIEKAKAQAYAIREKYGDRERR